MVVELILVDGAGLGDLSYNLDCLSKSWFLELTNSPFPAKRFTLDLRDLKRSSAGSHTSFF